MHEVCNDAPRSFRWSFATGAAPLWGHLPHNENINSEKSYRLGTWRCNTTDTSTITTTYRNCGTYTAFHTFTKNGSAQSEGPMKTTEIPLCCRTLVCWFLSLDLDRSTK